MNDDFFSPEGFFGNEPDRPQNGDKGEASQSASTDFPAEEVLLKRNRDNVFNVIEDYAAQNSNDLFEERYNERFAEDYRAVLGSDVVRGDNGRLLPVKPAEEEALELASRYRRIGISLSLLLISLILLPNLFLAASALGLYVSEGEAFESASSAFARLKYAVFSSGTAIALINALSVVASLLFPAVLGMKLCKIKAGSIFSKPKIDAFMLIKLLAAGFALQIAASFLTMWLKNLFGIFGVSVIPPNFSTDNLPTAIVTTIYVAVLAPFFEEMFFRGLLVNAVSHINKRFAIFLSAFVFALYHMNLTQFTGAFLYGLLLAYTAVKAESIVPCIILHSVNNMYSIGMQILSQQNEKLAGTADTWVTMVVGLLGLLILLSNFGRQLIPRPTLHEKERGFACAKRSVLLVASIFVFAVLTLVSSLS